MQLTLFIFLLFYLAMVYTCHILIEVGKMYYE